jgi:hypothetical protein
MQKLFTNLFMGAFGSSEVLLLLVVIVVLIGLVFIMKTRKK